MRFLLVSILTVPLFAAERGEPSFAPPRFPTLDALVDWTMSARGFADVECRFTGADPAKPFALVELAPYSGRATHHWLVWVRDAEGWRRVGAGRLREDDRAWEFAIDEEPGEVVLSDQQHHELRRVPFEP